MNKPRLALMPDFAEEQWPSMDLCAEQLLAHFPTRFRVERLRPSWQRRFTRLPVLGRKGAAFNADRIWNRFRNYPRHLTQHRSEYDLFHVADHSYSHLVHSLPAERTGVMCHDLDAFRCLLEPDRESRPKWFRNLMQRVLSGLQSAAVVFTISRATREGLQNLGLVAAERLIESPLGVSDVFTAIPSGHRPAWLVPLAGQDWILHVGSCIPRKRIDVLLDVLAAARRARPKLMLLKIGGTFTPEQQSQIQRLNLGDAIHHVRGVTTEDLAATYRAAPLVVMTSDAEGFGLPVVEALACGAKVLASDLAAMREAGGTAAIYAPVADTAAWTGRVLEAFAAPETWPPTDVRMRHAACFTWDRHAETVATAYDRLLATGCPT